ncbi:MAG: hypothetical protein WCG31_04720 [Deltaproteobacteria bacterium]|jgi:hypothetical protein
MKKVFGFIAATLLLAAPVMGAEVTATAPAYNCDFAPSCEVAPGVYGKMASPVTSKFNLSIGGFVKLDYAYNSVNLGQSGSLAPGTGQVPKTSSALAQREQSIFTARQSRFWLKVGGPTFFGAKTNALIEADFYGDPSLAAESPQLRMRQAWGSIDWANTSFLFGQAYDTFGPMVASTVDFRSGASFGTPNNPRVPQIRLTQKVNLNPDNALKLVLGVQDPNQNSNNNTGAYSTSFGAAVNVAAQAMWVSKALGVAPGYWGLPMNSLTAGFFGLYGSQKVADNSNRSVDSWGYGFYTFLPLLKSGDGKNRAMTLSFEGQGYLAANMAFNSATATTFTGSTGALAPAKGYGLGGQFIFYPTQDLGVAAGYLRRAALNYGRYDNSTYATANNYQKYNQNIFVNVNYDLNAAVRVAVEYENLYTQYGKVTDVAGGPLAGLSATGTANIARLALYYFF